MRSRISACINEEEFHASKLVYSFQGWRRTKLDFGLPRLSESELGLELDLSA
jgi:hypothetical protein